MGDTLKSMTEENLRFSFFTMHKLCKDYNTIIVPIPVLNISKMFMLIHFNNPRLFPYCKHCSNNIHAKYFIWKKKKHKCTMAAVKKMQYALRSSGENNGNQNKYILIYTCIYWNVIASFLLIERRSERMQNAYVYRVQRK